MDDFERADVIVGGPLTEAIVERAQALRLFHVFRGGIDGLGVDLLPGSVAVANTFHHEVGVAEFAVAAVLLLPRRIALHDRLLRSGDWTGSVMWGEPPEYDTLVGRRVLIVGVGHIGSAIAQRLRGFEPELIGVSRDPNREIPVVDSVIGIEQLPAELPDADFVVLSVRLAPNTEGLIGSHELDLMKETAYLVNVARGGVVDEAALYEALKAKNIAGAAVDVWYRYPTARDERCMPSEYPFEELDNVIMSCNRSSWTRQMLEGRVRDVATNVRRLAAGEPLINLVRPGGPSAV
jgi:phosphoglycerate dehydrogenase-like enzyme